MTIKLLTDWPYKRASGAGYVTMPAGAVVGVFDAATETGMIAAKVAIASAAAADWFPPSETPDYRGYLPEPDLQAAQSLVSRGGNRLQNQAMHKHLGALSTGDASNATYGVKWGLEADWDSVRLAIYHNMATAAAGWNAVVASTETASTATQDTTFRPVVGGTTYNAVRSATDTYGWDAVTWGGSATGTIGTGGSATVPLYILSDAIPSSSVPRADGGVGRLLMARLYKNGSAGEPKSFRFSAAGFDGMRASSVENRGRICQVGSVGSDAVTTLATSLTLGTQFPALFPVVRYRNGVVTVAVVSDSTGENFNETTSRLTNYNWRACYDLSTEALPVIPQNYGISGSPATTYLSVFKTFAPIAPPTIAIYHPFSPNDIATPTQRSVQDGLARAADFIDFCRENRIFPILATPFPQNGYAAGPDAFRVTVQTAVLAMAAARGVVAADFSSISDGASPGRYVTGYNADSTHPNEAGIEAVCVPKLKAAILQALAYFGV